jgi:hypothetical protein
MDNKDRNEKIEPDEYFKIDNTLNKAGYRPLLNKILKYSLSVYLLGFAFGLVIFQDFGIGVVLVNNLGFVLLVLGLVFLILRFFADVRVKGMQGFMGGASLQARNTHRVPFDANADKEYKHNIRLEYVLFLVGLTVIITSILLLLLF